MADEPPASEAGAGIWARSTAPQSQFSTRQVWIGFIVLAVGLLISFGLPLLFS